MTNQEKMKLEHEVFYKNFSKTEGALEDCNNVSIALYIGRAVGIMQGVLSMWPTEEGEAVECDD